MLLGTRGEAATTASGGRGCWSWAGGEACDGGIGGPRMLVVGGREAATAVRGCFT